MPYEKVPSMLKLFADRAWHSPWVFTVFVALTEKRIDFSITDVDLDAGAQLEPAYAAATLTARVPAIDHDGFVLSESMAILEYLEEKFPPPGHPALLPEEARERARARQLLHWLRTDVAALREERPTSTMFGPRASAALGEGARAAAAKLFAVAERVIPDAGGPLFGVWCSADADLAFALHRLLLNGDAVPERVASWARAEWQRPSVQAFVTRERPGLSA